MAVTGTPKNAAMVVVYQTGLSPQGAPQTRQRSFSYLRFDASEQDVYNAANALFSLTDHPVLHVYFRKNYELIDED